MSIFKKITAQIHKTNLDINNISSVKELIAYISIAKITSVAVFLAIVWVFSPIYVIVKGFFLENHGDVDPYINQLDLSISWYVLLQQIGFLGCFLIVLVFSKILLARPISKQHWSILFLNHSSELLLVCLFLWAIISTLFSENISLSLHGNIYRLDGLISYIAYAGVFFCGYLIHTRQTYTKVIKCFVWSSSLLALLMILDIEFINRLLTLHPNSAVFYNTNHFGYYLCMAIMSAAALYLIYTHSVIQQRQYLICFMILVAALVKNESFGPYLAVSSGILFLLIMTILYTKAHKKSVLVIIISFVLTSVVMNLFIGVIGSEIIKLLTGFRDIVQDAETAGDAGSNRWNLWVHGIQFIFEKPLLGYGPDNLGGRYLMEGIEIDRPHNEFIQIAASLGIPALLFYVTALLKHFSVVFFNRKSLTIAVISLNAIIVTYLVSSLFGNSMFYTSPFYFLILGITISNVKRWREKILKTEAM